MYIAFTYVHGQRLCIAHIIFQSTCVSNHDSTLKICAYKTHFKCTYTKQYVLTLEVFAIYRKAEA